MNKNFKKSLPIKSVEPPTGLFEKVMNRIQAEQKMAVAKRRLAIFGLGLVASLTAFIPVFKTMLTGFKESGFVEFFSLLFSDLEIILTYWQNFILTLLESLPAMSMAVFFFIIFIFLGSLKFLVKDVRTILYSHK